MKRLYIILFFLGCFCNSMLAQGIDYKERVHVYTDKDCYLSGEDMWVRLVVYDNNHTISDISKTGYIELANAEKPYVQQLLALEAGSGSAALRIPRSTPGGVYRLYGYTRFMRNEGEEVFFAKDIVIINPDYQDNNYEIINIRVDEDNLPEPADNLLTFGRRSPASVQLPSLPDNLIDVNVSVYREDISSNLPAKHEGVKFNGRPLSFLRWSPEYEGHIVTGRILSESSSPVANVAFVGDVICFVAGRPFENRDLVEFYTSSVYGRQEMVATLHNLYRDTLEQAKFEIVTPFAGETPETLSYTDAVISKQSFMERYTALQLNAEPPAKLSYIDPDRYTHSRVDRYDLDEYNQFPTLEETMHEFVYFVRVATISGKKRIRMFMLEEDRYNNGNTLVLLDGVPIFDHEQVLAYNPRFIQYLNVYNANYVFGGRLFKGIVSLVTYEGNLPHFILDDYSDLIEYTFPLLPETLPSPDYSDVNQRISAIPDMRSTLYWQPYTGDDSTKDISFHTSDLTGKYRIAIEGITDSGTIYWDTIHFYVK